MKYLIHVDYCKQSMSYPVEQYLISRERADMFSVAIGIQSSVKIKFCKPTS